MTLATLAAAVTLRDLTLVAPESPPWVAEDAALTLRRVRLVGSASGLAIEPRAEVSAEAFAVGGDGFGVVLRPDASFECTRCVFDGPGHPLQAGHQGVDSEGGRVRLREVTMRGLDRGVGAAADTELDVQDLRVVACDRGIEVSGSHATVTRFAAEAGIVGFFVRNQGTATLEDGSFHANLREDIAVIQAVVEASRVSTDGRQEVDASGRASIGVDNVDGRAVFERVVAFEPGQITLQVLGEATVTDLRVAGGFNGAVALGGRLEIYGARITDTEVGVSVESTGPPLTRPDPGDEVSRAGLLRLEAVHIGDGAPSTGRLWVGVFVDFVHRRVAPRAELVDVHLDIGDHAAIGVAVIQGELDAQRVTMRARGDHQERTGIAVAEGAVRVAGATLELPRALTATRGSTVDLSDFTIDNAGWPVDAIDVVEGAELVGRRLTVHGDGGRAVVAQDSGSGVYLQGVRVAGGGPLAVLAGAHIELKDALLDRPVGGGLALVGAGATLAASGLWIRDGVPVFLGPRFACSARGVFSSRLGGRSFGRGNHTPPGNQSPGGVHTPPGNASGPTCQTPPGNHSGDGAHTPPGKREGSAARATSRPPPVLCSTSSPSTSARQLPRTTPRPVTPDTTVAPPNTTKV